jgi:hypothetical protein
MANKIKLSPATRELYEAMQNGVRCFYMPCIRVRPGCFNQTSYYFRSDTYKRCTKQAEALLKVGLVEKCNTDLCTHSLRVKKENEHGK